MHKKYPLFGKASSDYDRNNNRKLFFFKYGHSSCRTVEFYVCRLCYLVCQDEKGQSVCGCGVSAQRRRVCVVSRLWFGDVMEKGTFSHLCWCFTLPPITPPPEHSKACEGSRFVFHPLLSSVGLGLQVRRRQLRLWGCWTRWDQVTDATMTSALWRFYPVSVWGLFYRLTSSFTQVQSWVKDFFPLIIIICYNLPLELFSLKTLIPFWTIALELSLDLINLLYRHYTINETFIVHF